VGAAETDRQIIQKVTILWRSGSTLSTRSGSNEYGAFVRSRLWWKQFRELTVGCLTHNIDKTL